VTNGESKNQIEVTGVVTLRSASGSSLLKTKAKMTKDNISQFEPEKGAIDQTCDRLKNFGFRIVVSSKTSVSIAGPKQLFEKVFQTKLEKRTKAVVKSGTKRLDVVYFEAVQPWKIPVELSELVEAVAFAEPPILFE
jgi:subtilase family serine protease